ncbi:Huntingtin [Armadillidium vulgare]|nr:Huntingtin [Armadillidium vulgare]
MLTPVYTFFTTFYSTWLSPQCGLCSSVIAEVVKSMSILCDLFTASAHHKWILETLVPLHSTHPVEDHITFQYIIIATCKALATLIAAKKDVSSFHIDGVLHIVEAGLRSIQISVRTCALHGILYLLQSPPPDNIPSLINMVASYIAKHNDGRVVESESHQITVWEVWVFLVEKYSTSSDPALPSTALQMALTAAASPSTSPRILHQVLRGVERLILVQESTPGTVEVVLKLAMDLVLNSAPAVSLAALPLFLTALHCSTKSQSAQLRLSDEFSRPEDLASDPELLLQFMEKLSVLFDRIRVCLPFEAGVLAGLLGTCLLDILPASQLLNKVITEYISSHQPHPHLLAATLFQVFEAAIHEGGENLVQEWVLLSLSNFTQRTPVALAVWCLTCFFIAASSNKWLRAGFPSVQARLGKLDESDIQVFCLAGAQFRKSLATEQQRNKFDDVFHSASSPGSPFEELLNCLKHSTEMKKP